MVWPSVEVAVVELDAPAGSYRRGSLGTATGLSTGVAVVGRWGVCVVRRGVGKGVHRGVDKFGETGRFLGVGGVVGGTG
ncbi:hypothetical protein EV650_5202 [Kribbella kalugense]|uniref:Uncharacterized protein n=1 Tax=Kribbella kalugense TaxID=2512221 RepID=A0A4R7ZLB9_9ACTN|nr:hypothetical protein EV650_5202 [Kribbella kalugense]